MRYAVTVEKQQYLSAIVEIEADSPEEAVNLAQEQINRGMIQSSSLDWDDPCYQDGSFQTTGDVEALEEEDDQSDDGEPEWEQIK